MTQDIANIPLIARIFKAQGWTWFDSPEPPSENRIRLFLAELSKSVRKGAVYAHSGRLMVRNVAEKGQPPELEVFVNVTTPVDYDWPHDIGDGSADPA